MSSITFAFSTPTRRSAPEGRGGLQKRRTAEGSFPPRKARPFLPCGVFHGTVLTGAQGLPHAAAAEGISAYRLQRAVQQIGADGVAISLVDRVDSLLEGGHINVPNNFATGGFHLTQHLLGGALEPGALLLTGLI